MMKLIPTALGSRWPARETGSSLWSSLRPPGTSPGDLVLNVVRQRGNVRRPASDGEENPREVPSVGLLSQKLVLSVDGSDQLPLGRSAGSALVGRRALSSVDLSALLSLRRRGSLIPVEPRRATSHRPYPGTGHADVQVGQSGLSYRLSRCQQQDETALQTLEVGDRGEPEARRRMRRDPVQVQDVDAPPPLGGQPSIGRLVQRRPGQEDDVAGRHARPLQAGPGTAAAGRAPGLGCSRRRSRTSGPVPEADDPVSAPVSILCPRDDFAGIPAVVSRGAPRQAGTTAGNPSRPARRNRRVPLIVAVQEDEPPAFVKATREGRRLEDGRSVEVDSVLTLVQDHACRRPCLSARDPLQGVNRDALHIRLLGHEPRHHAAAAGE